ncbi:MAG TPA: methyltransferase domain-containing protein [Nitrospirota bacterium]|nr:methyltransferase domain-containing protein [Nitrospirota bacterium]
MQNWTNDQLNHTIAQWDKAIEIYYPQYLKAWRDPREHYRSLHEEWNLLDAIKLIDWGKYINKSTCSVLDIGGGTGWLSAYLSKLDQVRNIFLLDSSEYFLTIMFPEIARLMDANTEKITPVLGLFSPILFDNESVDIVVASSSLHHSDNLENILKEAHRVIKEDGILFILNENPHGSFKYLLLIFKQFLSIMTNSVLRRYKTVSPSISSSGYLYDAYLGDRFYPRWYWEKAITTAGFDLLETIETPYLARKKDKKGTELVHFVCGKSSNRVGTSRNKG